MVYNAKQVADLGLVGYRDRHTVVRLIQNGQLKAKVIRTPKCNKYFITTENINEFLGV